MKEKKGSLKTTVIEDERDRYLSYLHEAIDKLHKKATNGRINDVKKENIKISYWKALIYAINVSNSVYKDKQIDKLEKDIEDLKKGITIEVPIKESVESESVKKIEELDSKIEKLKE